MILFLKSNYPSLVNSHFKSIVDYSSNSNESEASGHRAGLVGVQESIEVSQRMRSAASEEGGQLAEGAEALVNSSGGSSAGNAVKAEKKKKKKKEKGKEREKDKKHKKREKERQEGEWENGW